MNILERGITPNGTKVQIEDWNGEYSFKPYGATIGAYPVAKESLPGQFAPKRGRTFRLELDFASAEEAQEAFSRLASGKAQITDYVAQINAGRERAEAIAEIV